MLLLRNEFLHSIIILFIHYFTRSNIISNSYRLVLIWICNIKTSITETECINNPTLYHNCQTKGGAHVNQGYSNEFLDSDRTANVYFVTITITSYYF